MPASINDLLRWIFLTASVNQFIELDIFDHLEADIIFLTASINEFTQADIFDCLGK